MIIVAHLPLARRLALRYNRAPHCADDLVQVASVGLIKAADRWDPGRGVAFSTYAVPTILGELRHYCRDFTWAIRPPRGLQDLCLAIGNAREQLHDAIGGEPTVDTLAERLDRTPDEIIAALAAEQARTLESLDAALDAEDSGLASTGDLIGNNDEEYERVEARDTVERLTSILDARAREVLRLRHENDLPQAEIAARLGLTQVHVSRILRASYDRLAAYSAARAVLAVWLAAIAPLLPLPVAVPVAIDATAGCLVFPRVLGTPLLDLPRAERRRFVARLPAFVRALHALDPGVAVPVDDVAPEDCHLANLGDGARRGPGRSA